MAPVGIAIVGLGRRTLKRALNAILNGPEQWKLTAATDPLESARESFKAQLPHVPVFQSIKDMLEWNQQDDQYLSRPIKAAYVAVPHHCYAQVVPDLLSAGIHLLKEKPAATTPEELSLYQDLAERNSVVLIITGQRRYGSAMVRLKEWLQLLGDVASIEANLKICVSDLGEGWRADAALAGGGAMADVGWHLLDMVIGLTSMPPGCTPTVAYARLFHSTHSTRHALQQCTLVSSQSFAMQPTTVPSLHPPLQPQ